MTIKASQLLINNWTRTQKESATKHINGNFLQFNCDAFFKERNQIHLPTKSLRTSVNTPFKPSASVHAITEWYNSVLSRVNIK